MLGKPWWELWPGRLDYELKALEAAGIRHQRDQGAEQKGILVLALEVILDGRTFRLSAEFPRLYPFFRPEVFAPAGTFTRHQNPLGGNLCLLGRSSSHWDTDQTLAELIVSQLPKLIKAAETSNESERRSLEEPIGEPVTAYFILQQNGIILNAAHNALPREHLSGKAIFALEIGPALQIRGELRQLRDPSGKILHSARALFAGHEIPGRWVRLG